MDGRCFFGNPEGSQVDPALVEGREGVGPTACCKKCFTVFAKGDNMTLWTHNSCKILQDRDSGCTVSINQKPLLLGCCCLVMMPSAPHLHQELRHLRRLATASVAWAGVQKHAFLSPVKESYIPPLSRAKILFFNDSML